MPFAPVNPGHRFALEADGTTAMWRKANTPTVWNDVTAQLGVLNGVASAATLNLSVAGNEWTELGLVFPEPRDLRALRWHGSSSSNLVSGSTALFYSLDTTDGVNGTWVQNGSSGWTWTTAAMNGSHRPPNITDLNLDSVRGIRMRLQPTGSSQTIYYRDIQLFGFRSTAPSDRLAFWDPAADALIGAAALDYGDIERGVTQPSRQFRIKNLSSALTANGVAVAYSDLTSAEFGGTTGQVSTDNATWVTSINLGDIAPGEISAVCYHRQSSSPTATPALRAGRLKATATGWA